MQLPLFMVAVPMKAVEEAVKADEDKIVSFGLCSELGACPLCDEPHSVFDLAVVHGLEIKSVFHSCVQCRLAFDFVREVRK